AADAGLTGTEVYSEVLAWKGLVSARQQAARAFAPGGAAPEVARLRTALAEATRQLATRSQTTDEDERPADRRRELERLSDEVERLERELAERSAVFRQEQAQRRRTPAEICQALPADCVLLDLFVYDYLDAGRAPQRAGTDARLLAFVLRPPHPTL